MMALWWLVVRKIIRISKRTASRRSPTSCPSRYGKSALLAGLVTLIAVVGIVPYIALQLKAISGSYTILVQLSRRSRSPRHGSARRSAHDTAFWSRAAARRSFTILFGTRHLDASERHEGMVAAIAFESLVKLVAFLAVGVFVTYGMYGGIGDLFAQAPRSIRGLSTLFAPLPAPPAAMRTGPGSRCCRCSRSCSCRGSSRSRWSRTSTSSTSARRVWLFPLYMLAMNVFVRADRLRRASCTSRRRRRRPRHVRADAADGGQAGGAGAARVHRRAVGGDRAW